MIFGVTNPTTTSVADGIWHHVAYVNHSNQTGDLWIDGVLEVAGASSAISGNTIQYRIANFMRGHSFPNPEYVSGNLDDVRVYNHSLTAGEVASLQSATVPEPATTFLFGLVAVGLIGCRRIGGKCQRRTRRGNGAEPAPTRQPAIDCP